MIWQHDPRTSLANRYPKRSDDYVITWASHIKVAQWLFGKPFDHQVVSIDRWVDDKADAEMVTLVTYGNGRLNTIPLHYKTSVMYRVGDNRYGREQKWDRYGVHTADQRLEMFVGVVLRPFCILLDKWATNLIKDKHHVNGLFSQGLPRVYWDRFYVTPTDYSLTGVLARVMMSMNRGQYDEPRKVVGGMCQTYTVQKLLRGFTQYGYPTPRDLRVSRVQDAIDKNHARALGLAFTHGFEFTHPNLKPVSNFP